MKAIIHSQYGPADEVLSLQEVAKPLPLDNEVLIHVRAASMHADVWHVISGLPYLVRLGNGVRKPKRRIPGTDLAGVVVSVGKDVQRLKVGDEVFGESVKFGWSNGGAFAEYATVPEAFLVTKPANISFEQAAAVPTPGAIALMNLRSTDKPGHKVLINGAGGAMGTLAIQIAKAQGARVTAVDCADRLAMMRSLGADHVIDYAAENYLQGSERYDLIMDIALVLSEKEYQHALTPAGRYVPIGHAHYGKAKKWNGRMLGSMPYFVWLLLCTLMSSKKRKDFKMHTKLETMTYLRTLIASGQLTPVVGKVLPLNGAAEAMRLMVEEKTIGRIILTP